VNQRWRPLTGSVVFILGILGEKFPPQILNLESKKLAVSAPLVCTICDVKLKQLNVGLLQLLNVSLKRFYLHQHIVLTDIVMRLQSSSRMRTKSHTVNVNVKNKSQEGDTCKQYICVISRRSNVDSLHY